MAVTLMLHLTRRLGAPPDLPFAMWTAPDAPAQSWGPRGFTPPSIELDARVGGGYRIEMQPPDGDRSFPTGEFCTIDTPARLTYTFRWEHPDRDAHETPRHGDLADLGDATDVASTTGRSAPRRVSSSSRIVGPRRSTDSKHSSRRR